MLIQKYQGALNYFIYLIEGFVQERHTRVWLFDLKIKVKLSFQISLILAQRPVET